MLIERMETRLFPLVSGDYLRLSWPTVQPDAARRLFIDLSAGDEILRASLGHSEMDELLAGIVRACHASRQCQTSILDRQLDVALIVTRGDPAASPGGVRLSVIPLQGWDTLLLLDIQKPSAAGIVAALNAAGARLAAGLDLSMPGGGQSATSLPDTAPPRATAAAPVRAMEPA